MSDQPTPVEQPEQSKRPGALRGADFTQKVKRSTNVHKLANSISHGLNEYKSTTLRCVGAGATQQATKAIAIASGRERTNGYDLVTRISMQDVPESDRPNSEVTVLLLRLERLPI